MFVLYALFSPFGNHVLVFCAVAESLGVTSVLTWIALLPRATHWSFYRFIPQVNVYDIMPRDGDKIFKYFFILFI